MTSVPYRRRPTGLQLSGEREGSAAYRRLAEANPAPPTYPTWPVNAQAGIALRPDCTAVTEPLRLASCY
jgi:hypothetical protein